MLRCAASPVATLRRPSSSVTSGGVPLRTALANCWCSMNDAPKCWPAYLMLVSQTRRTDTPLPLPEASPQTLRVPQSSRRP